MSFAFTVRRRIRWGVLAATALGAFSATYMGTSVNVALPTMVEQFGTTFPVVQWVVLAYLLSTCVLLPIIGRVADMIGKRSIFTWGFAIFGAGSLACGLAPTTDALVALRVFQAIGSAILASVGFAIITDVFPEDRRGLALGLTGAVLSVGLVTGPTAGGFLVEQFGWPSVFFAGVPISMVGGALGLRFIPRYPRGDRQQFDLAGAVLLPASLLCLSLGLTLAQGRGFAEPLVMSLFGMASVSLGAFVLTELRVDQPLVAPALFREPRLTVGLVAGFVTFVSIAGTIFVMPFYLENVLGYAPARVGLLLAVAPVLVALVAPMAGLLADRLGERPITVAGLLILLVGYISIGTLDGNASELGFVARFAPVGLGMGLFQTPNNSAIMGSVPRGRSGVAGGLLALTRTLGQTTGIAVLGSLWASRVAARADLQADRAFQATQASADLQVAGLHDMLVVVEVSVAFALVLCAWDWVRGGRPRPGPRRTASDETSS